MIQKYEYHMFTPLGRRLRPFGAREVHGVRFFSGERILDWPHTNIKFASHRVDEPVFGKYIVIGT